MRTSSSWFSALAMAGALALGCGDDDGGANPDAASNPDGSAEADAAEQALLRNNTIAIFEAKVVNPEGLAVGLQGGEIRIDFEDETTPNAVQALDLNGDGQPDSNIGGCRVTRVDVGVSVEKTKTDEGVISVTGTGITNGDFNCAFNETAGEYKCQMTDADAAGVLPVGSTATPVGSGAVLIAFNDAGKTFGAAYQGTGIVIAGFPDAAANGAFPVISPGGTATSLVVFNPDLAAPSTVTVEGTYATFVGEGPVPAAAGPTPFNFLQNDSMVTLNGPTGSSIVDPWSEASTCTAAGCTYTTNGENSTGTLDLDDASAAPNAFPVAGGVDFALSCGGTGGNCGRTNGGTLNAFIISGETTDAVVPVGGANNLKMPDPVTSFATFSCAFLGQTSGTMPAAAVDAILATNPTRIQVNVISAGGVIAADDDGESVTNILTGHAVVGFTDVP